MLIYGKRTEEHKPQRFLTEVQLRITGVLIGQRSERCKDLITSLLGHTKGQILISGRFESVNVGD
jgi:hypothetical protein